MIAAFDKNGNGILTREEFALGLKKLGIGIPFEKIKIMVQYIDKNENGTISIDEFISALYESIPSGFYFFYNF